MMMPTQRGCQAKDKTNVRMVSHGRIAMKLHAATIALLTTLLAGTAANTQTPSWTTPPDGARCPSKWGSGDERGAANHMKPQTVVNATKLIKTGEVIELGH